MKRSNKLIRREKRIKMLLDKGLFKSREEILNKAVEVLIRKIMQEQSKDQ